MIGVNPKVICDEYEFILENFIHTMPLYQDSFAFPTQYIQVFYSNDKHRNTGSGNDWKVICGTNMRGRRGDVSIARSEIAMLVVGQDSDFKGLRIDSQSVLIIIDF